MTAEDHGTTETGATSRRAVLFGASAVGAAAMLTACAADDASTSGTGAPGTTAAPPPPPAPATTKPGDSSNGGKAIAKTNDIPEGGGKIFNKDNVVITQPAKDEFKAFSATCTHQQCPVANVQGGTINCTCHGSKFSIEDGSVKAGPARKPLEEKTVTVEGRNITLS